MRIWLTALVTMLALAALAACNAANNAKYQTGGGGWDNFRADAGREPPAQFS